MMKFYPEGTRILNCTPLSYLGSELCLSSRSFRIYSELFFLIWGCGGNSSLFSSFFSTPCDSARTSVFLGAAGLTSSSLGWHALKNSSSCCFLSLRSSLNFMFSLMVLGRW